ncbi:metabolism of cobalamin associated Da isoform X2 [Clupea harengus]|uniref:Metabolism of cobalamin associated Da isoform X2 n=1 Tax=Clupea harengus TaxID=7950 RepID=A0A6P8ER49_CLUHA|nr:metabolism of cobalamin associated Da isoform X2 [Clupea harengus]
MASVLCRRARLVSQISGIHGAQRVPPARAFSAAGSSGSDEPYVVVSSQDTGPRTIWPDEHMGPFGQKDQRFQLPGNVGFACHLEGTGPYKKGPVHRTVPDVLTSPSNSERHEFVLAQFVSEFQGKEIPLVAQRVSRAEQYFDHSNIECSMHPCPELLKKELELFFPAAPAGSLMVVTVTQKTLGIEGEDLDLERQQLLDKFVSGAKELCFTLWRGGFWADFINPTTGQAHFGYTSSDSVLKMAESVRHLGFRIEELGSCKVIRHVLTGTHAFAGTLFTNAPSNSHIMESLQGHSSAYEEADI